MTNRYSLPGLIRSTGNVNKLEIEQGNARRENWAFLAYEVGRRWILSDRAELNQIMLLICIFYSTYLSAFYSLFYSSKRILKLNTRKGKQNSLSRDSLERLMCSIFVRHCLVFLCQLRAYDSYVVERGEEVHKLSWQHTKQMATGQLNEPQKGAATCRAM